MELLDKRKRTEMNKPLYPILEFDPTREAVIEPSKTIKQIDVPEHCIICFFREVIKELSGNAKKLFTLYSEAGKNPVYEIEVEGKRLALFHPGVGAPLAAGFFEETVALGCRKFIACGSAGVLDGEIPIGHVVIPSAAIRDEGTSYHYLPPSREVECNQVALNAIKETLDQHSIDYRIGKTWTTDGVYRETRSKVKQRKEEGCITVEMETAAFFAVAQFRKVTFGQLLYGGDDVSGQEWDTRNWHSQASTREKLFWLATEACLKL